MLRQIHHLKNEVFRCQTFCKKCRLNQPNRTIQSLIAYGENVLRSPDAMQKVRLTFECKKKWDADEISFDLSNWSSDPPEFPARNMDYPRLYKPTEMPPIKDWNTTVPIAILHALAHIELGAVDNYWDTIVRFDPKSYGLPQEYYRDFLKVAVDEARHFDLVQNRLKELGSYYGALPAHLALLEHANNTADDLGARLAVVPLVQEARGLDSGERLVHKLMSMGDRPSAEIVKLIVKEEEEHVSYGVKWFQFICKQLSKDPIPYFQELVLQKFPEGLPGPFNIEARLKANMTTSWYLPLEMKRPNHTIQSSVIKDAPDENNLMKVFSKSKQKVILAGPVWPESSSSAAGVRSSDMLEILQRGGYDVLCVSSSKLNHHTEELIQTRRINCIHADPNSTTFENILIETVPDIIILDRFIAEEMYGWQAQKYASQALRVLDLQDLHFLRKAREHLIRKSQVDNLEKLLCPHIDIQPVESQVLRELASIHRSDLTLFVSDREKELLTERFQISGSALARCDYFQSKKLLKDSVAGYKERKHIAFIGNFKHAPNYDGMSWFKQRILPAFRDQMPSSNDPVEIHVYGAYADTHRVKKLEDAASGMHVLGRATDVLETLQQYRLTIAPLRFGAGIKGKIIESWAAGTPCISTCIGAEGMELAVNGTNLWGGSIVNDELHFAEAMQKYYNNQKLWERAQEHGFTISKERYDWDRNGQSFLGLLGHRLEQKRAQNRRGSDNWIGRILWSEKYRASEYMSRYLRAKKAGRMDDK